MWMLTKKNLRLIGYAKLLALFAGSLLFAISGRVGTANTFEQHILSVVSDHYYLTYFMLPLVLFSCFSFIEDDGELIIMRFRSYFSYFCNKWMGSGRIALLFITVQTVSIFVSGIGLSNGNFWGLSARTEAAELYSVLQQYFSNPLAAFVSYTAFQCLGIWLFIGICMWIRHFAGRKWTVRIIMFLYVLAAAWIKIPELYNIPITGLNHLLILHHNINGQYRFIITVTTIVLLTLLILFMVRYRWCSSVLLVPKAHGGLIPYYLREFTSRKNSIILCTIITTIVLYKGLVNPCLETSEEWVCFLFAGHGTGYFQVQPFLEMLIVNGAVLYLLASFLEKAVSRQSMFISVRTKGRWELLISLLMAGIYFLILYCLFWLIGGFIGSYLFGYGLTGQAWIYLVSSIALKLFDLLFQYMIMLAVYLFTKQITMGFIILLAGNFLCIIPLDITMYLPFGLSNMARINLYNTVSGLPIFIAFGILVLLVAIIFLWFLKYGWRKLLN